MRRLEGMNWQQRQEADARANFTILADSLATNYGSWDSVPPTKQVQIRQLALQARIPEVMLPHLIVPTAREIRHQFLSDDETTLTILYEDGTTRVLQSGFPRKEEEQTQNERLVANINTTMRRLEGMAGADGFVSPQSWNIIKRDWINAGLDPDRFISQFYLFINPTHSQDYGVGEARYIGC